MNEPEQTSACLNETPARVVAKSKVNLPSLPAGHVWLVGAGPGDPGLLTLHAVNALQQADVIIYDALVDDTCLSLKRDEATVEYAGKRGGKPSPKQRDISLRLVELAKEGKKVLRLKGGDRSSPSFLVSGRRRSTRRDGPARYRALQPAGRSFAG